MIQICEDAAAVGMAAAAIFVRQAQEAVAARGVFSVALAGGSTPKHCYELLAQAPRRQHISWPDVQVFWGDERCVGDDDPRNNARMARQSLLNRVPIVTSHIHPIRCNGDAAAEAARYDKLLRHALLVPAVPGSAAEIAPTLDLVLLGLGQNGHTASLLPASAVLQERQRWAAEVTEVAGTSPEVPRITMTLPILNGARMVVFMAFGEDKAEVVRAVLQGPQDGKRLPAQLIRPVSGVLIWLLDRQAASLLDKQTGE